MVLSLREKINWELESLKSDQVSQQSYSRLASKTENLMQIVARTQWPHRAANKEKDMALLEWTAKRPLDTGV